MTRTMQKTAIALLLAASLLFLCRFNAQAASGKVSFNDPSVTVGDTVTVTMTAKSDDGIGTLDATLTYDTSMLEYVSGSGPSGMGVSGGSGSVYISWYDVSGPTSLTCTMTFRALKTGSTVIKPSTMKVRNVDEEDIELTSEGSSTVTINAVKTASSEARLSALKIAPGTLSPSFSSDVYEYSATVSNDTTKLVVSVTTKDSNATYSVSGTSLSVGTNTTTVKVTAEDGSTTKTYYIYTTRQAAASDDSDDDSDDSDTTETPDDTETPEEETPTVTAPTVTVDGQALLVALSLEGVTLPDGFETATYTYADTEITVAVGTEKPLTLFWLTDEAGENGAFYVYDEASDSFYRMVDITADQKVYTIIPLDDETLLPDGYTETTVDIGGETVTAWSADSEETADFVLVYAMNWEGETGFYRYDTVEETLQRYVQETLTVTESDTEEIDALNQTIELQKNQVSSLQSSQQQLKLTRTLLVLGLAVEAVIFALILVFLRAHRKNAAGGGGKRQGASKSAHTSAHEDDSL